MNYYSTAYSFTFILDEEQIISGTIHSVYEHAINVQAVVNGQVKLITCLQESTPFVVDSFLVEKPVFERIGTLKNKEVQIKKGTLAFDGFNIELVNSRSSQLVIQQPDKKAVKKLLCHQKEIEGLKMINEVRKQKIMESLHCFAKTGDFDKALDVAGFGSGLTPGSDDALVGIMMILDLHNKVHYSDMNVCENRIRESTTDVSAKYLIAALNHHYSQLLLNLLDALSINKDVEEAINALCMVGATSGKDMLQGVIIALGEEYK